MKNDQASYLWFWTWIWTRAVQFSYSTVHNRSVFTLELQSSIDVRCRKPAFASKARRTKIFRPRVLHKNDQYQEKKKSNSINKQK